MDQSIKKDLASTLPNLAEKTLSSRLVYDGGFLKVYADRVSLPNGKETGREYFRHPGAAAIVPVLDNGDIVLLKQFRYPNQQVFIELPAGKIDPNEADLATAKRELKEETGYVANQWHELVTIHNAIAYCDERIVIYAAEGLTLTGQMLDENEFVEVFTVSLGQAMEWIKQGIISDVKTMIGLYHWRDIVQSRA